MRLRAVAEPAVIALQHFEPGQHVVAEAHRLRHLQVGEAGQNGIRLAFGEIEQAAWKLRMAGPAECRSVRAGRGECRSRSGRCASARCAASCRRRR